MDWNWFFSSLAQSAAAIVGIFGAFIITKILSNQAAFSVKKSRLQELIRSAEKLSADANSFYFNWYNKHTSVRQFEELEELVEKGAEEDAEALYERLNFSPFIEKAMVIRRIETFLETRRERKRKEQEEALRRAEAVRRGTGRFGADIMMGARQVRVPANLHISGDLNKEREAIESSIRECRHHMRRISDFRDSIIGNPESSPQIRYALASVAVLFYVGVIYPLSFMPLPLNAKLDLSFAAFFDLVWSLQGFLLAAVALIFSSVLAMFFRMNESLKYSTDELAALERFSSIGAYSPFYSIMEANRAARAAKMRKETESAETV